MPTKATEFQWGFSLNKQSALGTAIIATQINKSLPQRTFAPLLKEVPNAISDRSWFGKGHNFATFWDPITQRYTIPSRELSMTQLSALHAFAFVLGKKTSSQPNTATAPTVYDHLFTFQDPSVNPNVLFTSMLEKAGTEWEYLFEGVVVDQCTVRAMRDDHVVLSWEGHARTKANSAQTIADVASGQSYFKLLKSTINFGTQASPPAITAIVDQFQMTFSQNPNYRNEPGNTAGQEDLLSRILIGDQTVSGSIRILLDATNRAYFLNNTLCQLTVVFDGDVITGAFTHRVTINIPRLRIPSEAIDQEGDQAAITLNFDENTVLKDPSSEYVNVTVRTNVDNTELLVNA